MDAPVSSLREVLRNLSSQLVSRSALGIAFTLVLPACASLVGLESSQTEPEGPTGSPKPASELPPDKTLPAPRPTENCPAGTVDNCGYCGHSCAQTAVVQAPIIRGFTSDGTSLWMISDKSPVRCRADGPVTQLCEPIVRSEDVDARMGSIDIEIRSPWGGGGQQGGGKGNNGGGHNLGSKALEARSITREQNHIVITDDAYHAVLACPLTGSCTAQNLAIIDARSEESFDTKSFGPSIASGPSSPASRTSLSWSQGNALFANLLPADGKTEQAKLSRNDSAVDGVERILAPAGIFWISPTGLHHTISVQEQPQRWSARVSRDLAVDANSVYLAGKDGLFRIARTPDRGETVAAQGEFIKVASEGNNLYATKPKSGGGGGTAIVEIRQGQQLELTSVAGSIDSLAIVGNQLYFQTRTGAVDEIRRVAR